MRRNNHILGIIIMLVVLGAPSVVSAQHVVIAVGEGLDLDIPIKIMTEAYKRIGVTMEIRRLPFERALQMVNDGKVDGDLIRRAGIERDYPHLLMVPVAINTEEVVVVTKDKTFDIDGWKSLIPYRVGYIRGVKVVELNLVEGTVAEAVNTGEQAYRKLAAGRTDVVVDARTQAQLTLNTLGLDELVVLEPPIATIPFFHYLYVKNQQMLEPLTTALQQMEQEGLIQRMYQHVEETGPSPSK